jgi:transposase
MTQSIIGIDVSKLTLDVALLQEGRAKHLRIKNDLTGFQQLGNWLQENGCQEIHACMEATGQYGYAAADFLYLGGFQVSVVNPARIKAYASSRLKRNKTDKTDALLIAEFCQREKPALWSPPRTVFRALKALVHQLDALKACKRQQRNRLEFSGSEPLVDAILHEHIEFLDAKIEILSHAIRELILRDAQLKRNYDLLLSIPGIGEVTAVRLLAEIRDFHEFKNARQLTAYAGLNPRQYQSGTSVHRKSMLSKTGNAILRRDLYMPAIVAMTHNPVIHEFCQRLSGRGLPKMAIVGAAMRKLLVLVYGVIKSDSLFDPHFVQKEVICA